MRDCAVQYGLPVLPVSRRSGHSIYLMSRSPRTLDSPASNTLCQVTKVKNLSLIEAFAAKRAAAMLPNMISLYLGLRTVLCIVTECAVLVCSMEPLKHSNDRLIPSKHLNPRVTGCST